MAVLYAYGIYLSNGGTPEGFNKMTYSDIQVMLMAYTATKKKDLVDFGNMIAQMFGGENNG